MDSNKAVFITMLVGSVFAGIYGSEQGGSKSTYADFAGANFSDFDFSGTDFAGAKFTIADFSTTNLPVADTAYLGAGRVLFKRADGTDLYAVFDPERNVYRAHMPEAGIARDIVLDITGYYIPGSMWDHTLQEFVDEPVRRVG